MNKKYPSVIIAGLSVLAALATWHPSPAPPTADESVQMLEERQWVDAVPRSRKDKFNLYLFSAKKQGLYDRSESAYRHHLELYFFKTNAGVINFNFPHDNRKVECAFTIERLPRRVDGMDLKLELKNDPMRQGTQVYYGSSEARTTGLPLDLLTDDQ